MGALMPCTTKGGVMKRNILFLGFLFLVLSVKPAAAVTNGVIVRDTGGLLSLKSTCVLLGCNVLYGLDGAQGQVFLVTQKQSLLGTVLSLTQFIAELLLQPGVTNAEPDQILKVMQSSGLTAPNGLWDNTPVKYYGATVWDGYVHQPAAYIVRLPDEQSIYRKVTGSGTVAVIDTGIDPTHPVFAGVLVSGYDFTRNTAGGSELSDVNQSTMSVVNNAYPAQVNQSTMAVVNQTAATTFQSSQYAAFGHGTMTSGIIHLVAPTAKIMPLKAFQSTGFGNLSDILRAIYYAVQNKANVINMSFDLPTYSQAMNQSVTYSNRAGVICVASAGNDGKDELVYPAAFTSIVMGVASTNNQDQRSSFSNYGQDLVWVAAPGEGIISPYPYGTYAAGWGTSFSAPFVSGGAALIFSAVSPANQSVAAQALAHAKYINSSLNKGRIDLYQAVSSVK
ncbi:MAG: hypothetical protein DMG22_07680 [Acidobacteria bacterium]|nr:MAG: hypothetical protein DMG22_07680 [Acidobacteriota bacterium]